MNSFEQVRKTLLAASKEKKDYERALAEWEYRGSFYDNGEGSGICQLCGQRDIRYEFEIINQKTDNLLLVGSECITKFGCIKVYDEYGNQITGHRARAKVASDKRKLIAPPISIPKYSAGWRGTRAFICTSLPPARLG
ncbi:MAG TPA: hypothetical protein VFQ43_05850 [Nitrososphaera sp.]|nr:hypothetical protein [Nitrososphaera sp.]